MRDILFLTLRGGLSPLYGEGMASQLGQLALRIYLNRQIMSSSDTSVKTYPVKIWLYEIKTKPQIGASLERPLPSIDSLFGSVTLL